MIINNMRTMHFITLCMIAVHTIDAKSKIRSTFDNLFGRDQHEEIIQKEYPLKGRKKIVIQNTRGNITVSSEWNNQTLLLTATKKAAKPEYMESLSIDDSGSNNSVIKIETVATEPIKKASIDYTLVVPENVRLELIADTGNIIVKEVNGNIFAKTREKGNIDIENARGTIYAFAEKTGSITINQAEDNIQASAHRGNIMINNAKKSVVAQAERGKIELECLQVPNTSKLSLSTGSGNIVLRVPSSTNADLQAQTNKGSLTCSHYLTVKPLTTQLNTNAWSKFKREVDGTLGSGEAVITLQTGSGNIKIMDVTA